ncbi:zinc finger protein 428 isoform X1 [Monodelphis domestica]|uniref:zinc finger protein 428 isoform X1 n=1 Tax=Monodelphis domestica TaxID=13616 RepID=UPI0024E1E115|nr:zinc finger protein 428 isoform X1 [Monodelphis domestica]XP_056652957.1 zinc finger protein 428 isoform X1 [Monodelphis domestica]XP_056652958.1 zinc finger protein 428 isoform X1 [Monodelphis domestica]XP_056652959.1 zinc finger protein 428 isoform X1 [Monodelphis domestica]
MTETRETTETGGYASFEEEDEELSPGPEHPSDSDYTLSEPDSEEDEEEEDEEEETTDDPEYDPGYKVKQRLGGGRGAPSRRAARAAPPPGPQPCALCGRPPPGEGASAPGGPPCRLCRPAAPQATASARSAAQPQVGEEEDEEEDEDEGATSTGGDGPPGDEGGAYHCTECEDSFDDLGELHGHFMLHARGEV